MATERQPEPATFLTRSESDAAFLARAYGFAEADLALTVIAEAENLTYKAETGEGTPARSESCSGPGGRLLTATALSTRWRGGWAEHCDSCTRPASCQAGSIRAVPQRTSSALLGQVGDERKPSTKPLMIR
jgi:hypothetical protein